MTHPDLETTVAVPERSVTGMRRSGWVTSDDQFRPGAVLTSEQLIEKAEELGIDVDGRWGVDRLRSEVFEALASRDAGTSNQAADGDHDSPEEN